MAVAVASVDTDAVDIANVVLLLKLLLLQLELVIE